MTAPVTVSPESSIFAENRADAISGGALYLGGNPTAAALFGANQGTQWLLPATIAAAVLLGLMFLRRK